MTRAARVSAALAVPASASAALLMSVPAWARVNTVGLATTGAPLVREEVGWLATGINLVSSSSIPGGTQVRYYE